MDRTAVRRKDRLRVSGAAGLDGDVCRTDPCSIDSDDGPREVPPAVKSYLERFSG